MPFAFYSVPLALVLAVPFWFFAWTQVRQWQMAIKCARSAPT